MPTVANIAVSMTARTKKFERGMQQSRKSIINLAGPVRMVKRIALAAGAAITGVAATMAVMVRRQAPLIDSLAKTSDKLGVATDKLQALRHAANLSGVEANTLDMALQRMVRRVSEAAAGTGEAVKALAELGLDAQKLAAMSPDEQFKAIADAMSKVGSQSDRVRLAFKLFDSEGVALVNTLNMGRDAIEGIEKNIDDMGLSLTRVDAAKVEMMNDAWTKFQAIITGVWQRLTVEVAPFVTAMVEKFVEWGSQGGKAGGIVTGAIEKVALAIGVVGDMIQRGKVWVRGFGEFFTQVVNKLVQTAFGALRGFLKPLNMIGVVTDETMTKLNAMAAAAEGAAAASAAEFGAAFRALEEDPWSERIMEKFREIREAAEQNARKIAEAAERSAGVVEQEAEEAGEKTVKEAEEANRKVREITAQSPAAAAGARESRGGDFRQVSLRDVAIGGVAATEHDSEQARTNQLIGMLAAKFDEAIRAIERPTQIQFE